MELRLRNELLEKVAGFIKEEASLRAALQRWTSRAREAEADAADCRECMQRVVKAQETLAATDTNGQVRTCLCHTECHFEANQGVLLVRQGPQLPFYSSRLRVVLLADFI